MPLWWHGGCTCDTASPVGTLLARSLGPVHVSLGPRARPYWGFFLPVCLQVRRIAVLAEDLPEHLADFPERDVALDRVEDRWEQVLVALAGAAHRGQHGASARRIAAGAHGGDPLALSVFHDVLDLQRGYVVGAIG